MSAAQEEVNALFDQTEKLTSHPEDALQLSSDRSESSSDIENTHESESEDKPHPTITPSTTSSWHLPPRTTSDANTGPKGVIADARSFERARKHSVRQNLRSLSNNSASSPQPFTKTKMETPDFSREKSTSPEHPPDDDEEFVRSWRQNRMNELQDPRTRRVSPSKRKYGSLELVDAVGYLDAVEKVSAEAVVVVCIYDDESSVSGLVEDCLNTLARKHQTTRFIKLHYIEAEMDEACVPAVLAYKAGELFANLVAVIDEIPAGRDLSSLSLELVLKQNKVLF
ncbi:MAG: hypothetical protein M1830_008574 [Pleopsidium flavum]|nr:MAG: hypothetical protein M1830_008574 [Pleopsidium flavum]